MEEEINTPPPVSNPEEHHNLSSQILHKINTTHLSPYIHRVPLLLRRSNPEAYTPTLVSIGPLHHGNPSLIPMEYHKWRYLTSLFNRNRKSTSFNLSSCIRSLKEVEIQARNSYAEEMDTILTAEQFLTILLLDSCFLIELFLRTFVNSSTLLDDPIVNSTSRIKSLRIDILLAENQIPIFVIERIYQTLPISKRFGQKTVIDLALNFFKRMIPVRMEDPHERFYREGVHLLDVVRGCYLCPIGDMEFGRLEVSGASKLTRIGGIRIKRAEFAESFMDLRFEKGVLMIPKLTIRNHTITLMRNMIAVEQSRSGRDRSGLITSYAFFMRSLIEGEEDFNLLKRKRIIAVSVNEKKVGFRVFGQLCEGLNSESCSYGELCTRILSYERSREECITFKFVKKIHKMLSK